MNRKEIRQLIEKEISKTEKLIKDYQEMSQPVEPDDAIGRISRMDAINNQSVTEASLRQAREKLKNLEDVLSGIEKKGFGVCRKCGNEIHIRRIMFRPESTLCIRCAD